MEEKLNLIQTWLSMADEKIIVAQEMYEAAHFDDAVSRAYYGMFYAAKAALQSIDIEAKSHGGVLNQFSVHFIKTGKIDRECGRMLASAMQERQVSDYSPLLTMSQANAEGVISDARIFVAKVKEMLLG